MSRPPWAAHFGLTRTPFGKAIPAAHLFHRQAHAEAVARITFCVLEAALGVVTGDVGAGKTVSVRAAVAGLDPTRHQIIYIGQPTLNRQLRMGMFAALDQRILTRYTIKAMDLGESAAYLRHHLALAGREEPLFADDALARLHRVSNGLPRALNNAATAALIAAAADSKTIVDDACAKKAAAELTRD